MALKGTIITNAVTGESIEFVETAADTNGAYSSMLVTIKPGGFRPVMHIHTEQEENLFVVKGKLTYIIDGHGGTVGVGKSICLPKGIPHTHYNNESSDLIMLQIISPSLDIELLMENMAGLMIDGKVKNGKPPFLQLMVWIADLESKTYIASLPVSVQNVISFFLAPFARLAGYKASYKKYSRLPLQL